MTSAQQALVERWRGFLGKISERLEEICAEAGPGLAAIGEMHPEDSLPIGNAITGLDHRVRQLQERIGETWDAQVEPKFSEEDILDVGLDLKADAESRLEERWSLAKASWLSALAHAARPRAEAAMAQPVACVGCGGPLAPPTRLTTVAVRCGHCGVVNQVAPPMAVTHYFGWGVQNLAEAAALPHRHAVERQRVAVDRWRRARDWAAEPLESLEEWERLERAYWVALTGERARLTGEPADEKLIESRMSSFLTYSLESNQLWVRAKGKLGG